MPVRTVNLNQEHSEFIDNAVKTGEFKNGSEAIGAAVALLIEQTPMDHDSRLERAVATAFGPRDESEDVCGPADKVVAAMVRDADRMHALRQRLDALVDAMLTKAGDYDHAGEVLQDALLYLETRLDREPPPKGRGKRLLKKVAD